MATPITPAAHTWETPASVSTAGVTNPAPMAVYQTERSGIAEEPSFSYTFNGLEAQRAPTTSACTSRRSTSPAAGSRAFNVSINGTQVLTNFDIVAAAGGQYKAIVRGVCDRGQRRAARSPFSSPPGSVNYPKVSGIEIISTGPPPPPPAPTGSDRCRRQRTSHAVLDGQLGARPATTSNDRRPAAAPTTTSRPAWTTTSYTNTGLTNGTTYYYVVIGGQRRAARGR